MQTAVGCSGVADCRAQAEAAAARGDFEVFHDLAWRAVQTGRRNDPDLMDLLARAQSLSGRPGGAVVMLGRIADLGVTTDAATNEHFARVRRLPAWPELEAKLSRMAGAPSAPSAPSAPLAPAPSAPSATPAALTFDPSNLDPIAVAH